MNKEQHDCLVGPEVRNLIQKCTCYGTRLTWDEYQTLTINNYERISLYPYMDNDCLLKLCTQHFVPYLPVGFPSTYNEVVMAVLFPLILARLQAETQGNKQLVRMLNDNKSLQRNNEPAPKTN